MTSEQQVMSWAVPFGVAGVLILFAWALSKALEWIDEQVSAALPEEDEDMSYAQRLAASLRNAYEAHDRDQFEHELKRMVDTMSYTGPVGTQVRIPHPPGCTRKLVACECESDAAQSVCMFRKQE